MTNFTSDTFGYFADLNAENTKTFWNETAEARHDTVEAPFKSMMRKIESERGNFKTFRMHRDVRFSKDKSPYKTMMGAVERREGFHYVHIDAKGVLAGVGHYIMEPQTLTRFRNSLDGDRGDTFASLLDVLETKGVAVGPGGAQPLKTAPRGFAKDHPHIQYLRWKGAMAMRQFPVKAMSCEEAARQVLDFWSDAEPLTEFLRSIG